MRLFTRAGLLLYCAVVLLFASCKKETTIPETAKPDSPTQETNSGSTTPAVTTPATTTPVVAKRVVETPCCKTENVIIIVVDGARYTETWGDYTHKNIPNQYNLYTEGVLLNNFMNNGSTLTDPGHAAISTGNYENLDNWGNQIPTSPSMFQAFLKASGKPADKAWVITSKDKLEILSDCKDPEWAGRYQPRTDCGFLGLGTGYRPDDTTYARVKTVMRNYHPNLMLVNFKDPDTHGHGNLWEKYLDAIKTTDEYIKGIYDQIQSDPVYRDKTTLIVTNDHGRHSNGAANGFIDHGCSCEGCRHIQFFAIGPDLKKSMNLNSQYDQTDISATVAKLLNFPMPSSTGEVMKDIFN